MRFLIGILCLIAFAAAETLTLRESREVLQYHNKIRSKVRPTAANMMKLDYSREMEELASKWVDKCLFEHPDPQRYPEYRGLGQNIALSGGSRRNVLKLIKGWHREERDYDYKRNSCKRGKICSNYTQMIWATTTKVGCAIKRCNGKIRGFSKPVYLLACQYKPGGNYKGKQPYMQGKSCSYCPAHSRCVSNLCSRSF